MPDNNKNRTEDAYENFIKDVDQMASGDQERAFIDSIGQKPSEDTALVSLGERVRIVREKRELSLRDISQRTDIHVDVLTQIEKGDITPPLGRITKLAKSLEMKIGYFISGEGKKAYTVVKKADRKVISRFDSKKVERFGYEYESLAPHKRDRHMEPFLMTLAPSEIEDERSSHEGQEFIFVLEGKMEVRLGDESHILEEGDAIYYDSTVPHLARCYGNEATRILAVLYAEK